jgi:hypothetical protein
MGRYVTNKEGTSTYFVEKCAVNVSLEDIIDAQITLAIVKFEQDYEARLEDPSFYCDIENMEVDNDYDPKISLWSFSYPKPIHAKYDKERNTTIYYTDKGVFVKGVKHRL